MEIVARPIDLGEALTDLETIITNIRLKNTTMINYYIYPDPVPTQIAAFEPRLVALAERRSDVASLSVPKLSLLLDNAQGVLATYLLPLSQQLSASIDQFQHLMIEYYDRSLAERKPYLPLFQRLKHLSHDLTRFIAFHQQNRRPAVHLLGEPSTTSPSFCPAAVSFINRQDRGRVQACMPNELTSENKSHIKAEGGIYLWWECTTCAFRLRFHINNSASTNINSTMETRRHDEVTDVAYRSSWLAKSHLYHPGRDEQFQERERRRAGQRTKSISINTSGVDGVKYGCPFCFSKGKDLVAKETAFATAKEFAIHLSDSHTRELPAPVMLQNLKVGVNGGLPPEVQRWDLNLGAL